MVFNMLDENRDGELAIVDLVRFYVNVPSKSEFAVELRQVLQFYIKHTLKPRV